ncbi:glycogen phosphorylase [Calothrix sp. NIES-4071]|nr:glycogen phosphorylase [Calothrix sp. NIES-4071]BAZ62025.1 glycogen phosphorylase [Calothrix sp. NIES-4105]
MLMADYQLYIECQDLVSQVYLDSNNWTRMSSLNSARAGKFSSDRAIQEYCQEIWKIQPQIIQLQEYGQDNFIPGVVS